MKKLFFSLAAAAIIIVGCSSAQPTIPENNGLHSPKEGSISLNRWHWASWVFYVNEGHTRIEKVPIREVNLHYNVTKFVEGPPCPNCLTFGTIFPQGDGTFKIPIKIRHPFLGQLEYTGFDVRGTVVFPATHYWYSGGQCGSHDPPIVIYYDNTPLFFSHASAGGGQVLNADGYSFYFFPGFPAGPDIPICRYQKGKYATGTDDLDSTINPFIEFHSTEPRRMFLPGYEVTRTYHIKPPEGAFKFGYIVDASWHPPDVMPVTNPAEDFPVVANAEDGVSVKIEQVAPLRNGVTGYEVTRWTLRHREGLPTMAVYLTMGDIKTAQGDEFPIPIWGQYYFPWNLLGEIYIVDEYTDITTQVLGKKLIDNPPGKYLAVARALPGDPWVKGAAYFSTPFTYQIIELELVE